MLYNCDGCHQDFQTNSSLLRHISHRKDCLSQYGEEKFGQMKHEANLSSKQKWKKANAAKLKKEYHKEKYDTKNPEKRPKAEISSSKRYSYVPVAIRDTFEGASFLKFFQFTFERKKIDMVNNFENFSMISFTKRIKLLRRL